VIHPEGAAGQPGQWLVVELAGPELMLKNVEVQVCPVSEDRATAISVPVTAWKLRLKNTTI
jgi:hypothetical protein